MSFSFSKELPKSIKLQLTALVERLFVFENIGNGIAFI